MLIVDVLLFRQAPSPLSLSFGNGWLFVHLCQCLGIYCLLIPIKHRFLALFTFVLPLLKSFFQTFEVHKMLTVFEYNFFAKFIIFLIAVDTWITAKYHCLVRRFFTKASGQKVAERDMGFLLHVQKEIIIIGRNLPILQPLHNFFILFIFA